jgi:hypothetical protein
VRDPSGWIGTHSGTRFWPLEPAATEIFIEDIAHSLARQCRFNGHCYGFYSVAEHSIEVSRQVPPEFALWGLLHDAAEPYLSDQVRPVKSRCYYSVGVGAMERYTDAEDRLLRLIALRFGLPWPMPKEIGVADDRMLATERQQLFDDRQPHWDALDGIEPYPIVLRCMGWGAAEVAFITRFKELTSDG